MNIKESLEKKKGQLVLKRILDLIISFLGLVILSPILLAISLGIKLTSKGPVFFRQERVGKDGSSFRIYKFRTMVENATELGKEITVGEDKRITKLGKFLRKYKLDEFPQLINVCKGEMSLVGPRPEVPRYVAYYSKAQRQVLFVRPGITEEASIVFKDEASLLEGVEDAEKYYIEEIMPKKLAYNLDYLKNFSLGKDLALIFRTFAKVFGK